MLTVSVQSANAWHFSRSRRGEPSATAPGDASSGLKTGSASSDAGSMINHAQAISSQAGLFTTTTAAKTYGYISDYRIHVVIK